MFTTTTLIALQMKFVKRWPTIVPIVFFVVFGFFDGALRNLLSLSNTHDLDIVGLFWGAALKKVPDGAWVTLMVGLLL